MDDGSVVIGVQMNTAQADKDLAKLKSKIEKVENELRQTEKEKFSIAKDLEDATAEAGKAALEIQKMKKELADAEFALSPEGTKGFDTQFEKFLEYQEIVSSHPQKISQAEAEYQKLNTTVSKLVQKNADLGKKLEGQRKALEVAKEEAGGLQQSINQAAQNTQEMEKATKKANKHMGTFARRLKSIALGAFVFNILRSGFRSLTDWIGKVIKSNDQAKASIAKLKGALLTLAQPLIDVIIPAFAEAVNILANVATYIAQLVAILFGTTAEDASNAAKELYNEQQAIEGVGKAADDASKSLAGFDEINKLSGETAGSSTDTITPDFTGLNFSELPEWLASLSVTLRDIIFEWENLTAQDVLKKVVASLTTLAGTVIGFSIGGFGGAVIGMTIGATVGAWISDITFDGDKKMNTEELLQTLCIALMAIAGGIIGFSVGGVNGAAIGVAVGAGVSLLINDILFDGDGKMNHEEILKSIIAALGVIVGGILGFTIGGPGGAAIGVTVGAAITAGISDMLFDNNGTLSRAEVLKTVCTALTALVGGVIGFVAGGPFGAVIGITLGASAAVALANVDFDAIADTKVKRAILDSLVSALYIITGGVIGFAIGNVPGAILGMVIGATLKIAISDVTFDRTGNISKWGSGLTVGGGRYTSSTSWLGKLLGIPGLATGAVVPPNREFMAVLGDNKQETEVVSPLSTMKQAMIEALRESGTGGRPITVILEVDRREFGRAVFQAGNEESQRIGASLVGV